MNKGDLSLDYYMLKGPLAKNGYDWWWHKLTGYHRVTGEEKSFFIEYYICNPALGGEEAILGQLPENKRNGIHPSYVMIKAGAWGENPFQVNNFYPISQFSCPDNELKVTVGDYTLSETYMKGACTVTAQEAQEHPEYMSDAGEMSWDLKINKKVAYNVGYGASKIFRTLNAFEMFWHVEGLIADYEGEVILNGEIYDVTPHNCFGYCDKNWGGDYTSPWLWITSRNFKSLITGKELKNSAVEFGGGRPKVFGVPMERGLLGCLYYEGKMYDYNFSKFWTGVKIDFSFSEEESVNVWKVRAQNKDSVMKLILKCPKEEMIFINYESPNGQKLHNRLWNGGTAYGSIKLYEKAGKKTKLIDHIEIKNTGCEYGEYES